MIMSRPIKDELWIDCDVEVPTQRGEYQVVKTDGTICIATFCPRTPAILKHHQWFEQIFKSNEVTVPIDVVKWLPAKRLLVV